MHPQVYNEARGKQRARGSVPPPTKEDGSEALLALGEVLRRTTLSRSTLYALCNTGGFPRPIKLTSNRVAWVAAAVAEWIAARVAEAA